MKNIIGLLFLILFFIKVGFCQWTENLEMYISGGSSHPLESFLLNDFLSSNNIEPYSASNFEKYWNNGLDISAGLGYGINNFLSVRAGFSYSHFSFNETPINNFLEDAYLDIGPALGGTVEIVEFNSYKGAANMYSFQLSAKLAYNFNFVTPYVLGGGGYLYVTRESIDITNLAQDDIPAYDFSFAEQIPGEDSGGILGSAGLGIIFNITPAFKPFFEGNYFLGMTQDDDTIYYSIIGGLVFNFK